MAEKLVLLEFPDELFSFREYCRNQDSTQYTLISFQPKVGAQCKQDAAEMELLDTRLFFNNESHQRALEKSDLLTRLLAQQLDFKTNGSSQIPNTLQGTFVYYCRFYFNNYLRVLEIIRGIKAHYTEKKKDIEIYMIETVPAAFQKKAPETCNPFLVDSDRFMISLVEKFCSVNGIPFHTIPGTVPSAGPSAPAAKIAPQWLRNLARKLLIGRLKKLSREPVVFLAALSYNLDRLLADIQLRFPAVKGVTIHQGGMSAFEYLKFSLKELMRKISRKKEAVTSIPIEVLSDPVNDFDAARMHEKLKTSFIEVMDKTRSEFIYEEISLEEVLNAKVCHDLLYYLTDLHRLSFCQYDLLRHLAPNILLSPVAIDMFQAWGELCGIQGITAVVIPQKGLVAPINTFAGMEEYYIGRAQVTADFEYAVAQTPYVRDYMAWADYNGTILETGNLIFSRLYSGNRGQGINRDIPADKHIILYAPSMKSRKSHRFFVLETLDELVASIGDVMEAVSKLPDAHLVIRIHPGEPITRKEIESLLTLPENVSISDKGTFEEVLAQACLTISFSSTSIQESLLNGVPVLLYDRWKRYNHLDAPLVTGQTPEKASAAYYVNDAETLRATCRWILDLKETQVVDNQLFMDSIFPARYSEHFFGLVKKHIANN